MIVVPKTIPPREVPSRFRVGLPFQSAFGGVQLPQATPPIEQRGADQQRLVRDQPAATRLEVSDFAGTDVGRVHVLGGATSTQLELLEHGVQVGSVDGANIIAYARGGRVWTPRGQISRGNPEWTFKQRVRASTEWLRLAWNPEAPIQSSIRPTEADWLAPEALYDPYFSRAPPPCQMPECQRPTIAETRYTYCSVHRDAEPRLFEDDR